MDQWYIEFTARLWLKGIVMQGNRLLELSNYESSMYFDFMNTDKDKLKNLHDFTKVEEHFFVIAVGKAMDWLREFQDNDHRQENIQEFLDAIPHARNIRNMREHDDAYLKGEGRKQNLFHHEFELHEGKFTGSADATSTIVINDNYMIGGRLDVVRTIKAADKLCQFLAENITRPS